LYKIINSTTGKFERDVVYVHIWYFLIWNDHVLLGKETPS